MNKRFFKSSFYKKIEVRSKESHIGINCRSKPDFLYDMKYASVRMLINWSDIKNEFINVTGIRHESPNEKFMDLNCSIKSSYFSLKEDFSNIVEISDKFDTLLEELFKSSEWQYLFFEISSKLNYIKFSVVDSQKVVRVYVRKDFENFDNLQKYDFTITEKTTRSSDNKITFDGELLETDGYIVRFTEKPEFGKFIVNLDSRINRLIFSAPQEHYETEFMSLYKKEECKYDIYFEPSRVESFLYLNLLENISWVDSGFNSYTIEDIVAKKYDF